MRTKSLACTAVPVVVLASLLAPLMAPWLTSVAHADDDPPKMMAPDRPVLCYVDAKGVTWRVQCDEETKVCLYAPDAELDTEGQLVRPLERANYCNPMPEPFDSKMFKAKGFELEPGLPDAPYGWMRDQRGRVFQVNFDLKRRLYIGGSYAPYWHADGSETGRVSLDVGLLSYEYKSRYLRHRLRFVEGEVHLAPFSGRLLLMHYDFSRRHPDPLLRITTFIGKPRRGDLGLNIGAWFEGGDIELHDTELGDARLIRYATLHGTIDLWQSADLYSFVRLRGGLGWEASKPEDRLEERHALTPGGALEASLTLDRNGFHHLGAEVSYESPRYLKRDSRLGRGSERIEAMARYEVIVLAINDQPLSVYLAAGAEKRDDLEVLPTTWVAQAKAGLRFSLWAPPRDK